jgi:GNAT superfamily N-acetyltransferase
MWAVRGLRTEPQQRVHDNGPRTGLIVGARMTDPEWRIESRAYGDPIVEGMLADYLSELLVHMPDFDSDRAVPPGPSDFEWPNGKFLVIFAGGEPIACGAIRRLSEAVGELRRMWVNPAWRGRGVARFLLSSLEAAAREMEVLELRLDTNRALTPAIALYGSDGFVEVPRYNDNEFANIWMSKRLDA